MRVMMMAGSGLIAAVLTVAVSAQSGAGSYMTAQAIDEALTAAGKVSRIGASTTVARTPTYHALVRRRSASDTPQNAIVHPLSSEVYQIVDGAGTLVLGGVLDPPPGTQTLQLPNNVTSTGISGGQTRRVAKGDVVVIPAGTPHWFQAIDGTITYLEVQFQLK